MLTPADHLIKRRARLLVVAIDRQRLGGHLSPEEQALLACLDRLALAIVRAWCQRVGGR